MNSMGNKRGRGIARSRGNIGRLVLEEGLVRARNTLILYISMVLLVFVYKVVNNLHPAVWQLYTVLTFNCRSHS